MGGGLLEGERFDVVIVHTKVAAMAFEVGLREVVVKEGVVL